LLGNFGLPGTVNFIGELLILVSIFSVKLSFLVILFIGLLFTLWYSLFMYIRMVNGLLLSEFLVFFCDLTRREFLILVCFLLFILVFGFFPNIFLDYIFFIIYFVLLY
jgi:NADH-quinone oxidoreductase subunit M